MKKVAFVFSVLALGFTACEPEQSGKNLLSTDAIPDSGLRYALLRDCDKNKDGRIDEEEANAADSLSCSGLSIKTMKGIELFPNLRYLDCGSNPLTELDLSANTSLVVLKCGGLDLEELDLKAHSALTCLSYNYCPFSELDLSANTALETLSCSHSQLERLNVSGCTALRTLECNDSQLAELDLQANTALMKLDCSNNKLTELDLASNRDLAELRCRENLLTSLDVRANADLTYLDYSYNQLTSIDLRNNTMLTSAVGYSNYYHVTATGNKFDLNRLPEGFDMTKAGNWRGCATDGTVLTFAQPEVTYTYQTGYMGEDDRYKTVTFTLVCDNYDESLK